MERYQLVNHRAPIEARKRGLGEAPPGSTITADPLDLDVQSSTDGSAPSEARKRGSGEGSPRKYDNLPAGPSDLDVQSRQ
jgi:hypothetical protein